MDGIDGIDGIDRDDMEGREGMDGGSDANGLRDVMGISLLRRPEIAGASMWWMSDLSAPESLELDDGAIGGDIPGAIGVVGIMSKCPVYRCNAASVCSKSRRHSARVCRHWEIIQSLTSRLVFLRIPTAGSSRDSFWHQKKAKSKMRHHRKL